MTMERKKLAAVTAAVFTYIKTEEEAACFAAQAGHGLPGADEQPAGRPPAPNVWGSCGRSDLMQIRTMMQMRAFKQ
ncbi:MAG TPA: hypothetical protein VJ936_03450 [Desulfobacteraceae bacterium]|nr:hypothetical protein [Desulfobacteraceae bacterium]